VPVELSIETLDTDLRGIGVFEGRELRVAGALPGERVTAVRLRSRGGRDEARVDRVLAASGDRVAPRCTYFGLCGACTLQHLSEDAQVRYKGERLFSMLAEAGGVSPEQRLAPVTGPPWGYRRRARLGVRHVAKKGRVLVGFRERDAPYLADMRSCEVLVPEAGHRLDALSALIGSLSILDRIPQVELAAGDDAAALVFRVLDPPTAEDRDRLEAFGVEYGFQIFLQSGGPGTIRPLGGTPRPLRYRLAAWDVEIQFEPGDFIQVNAAVNEDMIGRAIELLDPAPGARILELFSGLGNFTLPLARGGARVTAVEGDPGLVARARCNAARNGLDGAVNFVSGNLFESCRDAPWVDQAYDAVLLDPPRAGARRVLEQVAAGSPARIVYVSCNPETLATDAGMLVRRFGYTLSAAGVMDMFPHTGHLESIALFEAR
jgi:23S rRNA (uracil1939-C5)-methyltransferase